MTRTCSFPGCDRAHLARGLCGSHHGQQRRGMPLRPLFMGHRRKVRRIIVHPDDSNARLIPLTKGLYAIIDAIDEEAASAFNWTAVVRSNTSYAGRTVHRENGKRCTECLHQFIAARMGHALNREVDHESGNGLDCRRDNLRPASGSQNRQNTKIRSDNSSGAKGVDWNQKDKRWRTRIGVDGREINLGQFKEKADAEAIVSDARKRLHGEFANDGMGA